MAISLPKLSERLLMSVVITLKLKSACSLSGRLRSSKSMRDLFSALALENIMRVIVASDALATVGQCSGSSGCAHGSELSSFNCPAKLRRSGMPGTVDSYSAKPKYAKARDATGGLKPGVCWVSVRAS